VSAALRPGAGASPRFTAAGFYGKIPSRGDFVWAGLPRSFMDPWDDWMQRMLTASRQSLGETWSPAWLEAPVWRFALAPRLCGPGAVVGLWLPSVDRAGRYFPLTLAALMETAELSELLAAGGGFLTAAEAAGRDAVADDLPPEALASRLAAAAAAPAADQGLNLPHDSKAAGLWWTAGAPRVAPVAFACPVLPDKARFAAMLDDRASPAS
jgi:type VI secretion system protein ImpM